jgi:hypothetical protein
VERRQRCAELVRRIGDELVLGAEERIELDDHVVELAGELLQLGRAVERRPRQEVPSGDLPGGGLDPSERSRDPAHKAEAERNRDGEDDDGDRREDQPVAVVGAVLAHASALVLDSTVHIGIGSLLVPGLAPYRPLWTGLGVLAAELMVVVYASFSLRKRIGRATGGACTGPRISSSLSPPCTA